MELSLVGAPNWNDSTCLDVFPNKPMFAFASRSYVVLMSITGDCWRKFSVHPAQIFPAHHDKLCGLACLPTSESTNHAEPDLVTCGEDGFVKVWNCAEQVLHGKLNLSDRDVNIKGKLTCVAAANTELKRNDLEWRVCAATECGTMLFWESKNGRSNKAQFKLEKEGIVHLSWKQYAAPTDILDIAVAYKKGLFAVYSITFSGTKVTLDQSLRLKGHEHDVVNIWWSPPDWQSDTGDLLTSSKDKSISLWSTHSKSKLKTEKFQGGNQPASWVSACWLPDGQIVVSNPRGELGIWNPAGKGARSVKYFAKANSINGHNRIVYCVRHLLHQWKSGTSTTTANCLVSISMDRSIIVWHVEDNPRPLIGIPTIGGAVYSLASSPMSPSLVAIGSGDSCIRLYRPTDTGSKSQITSIWNNINGRVTAMAWHPSIEGLLAYGTFDGRVGTVNTLGNKQGRLSNSHHTKQVYSLAWGPPLVRSTGADTDGQEVADDSLCLYSIGKGPSGLPQLYCHDSKRFANSKASDIGAKVFEVLKTFSTRCMDEPSTIIFLLGKERAMPFDLAVIGYSDGSIDVICCQPLVPICVVSIFKKMINELCWNPEHLWLACGSNLPSIGVLDLTAIMEKFTEQYATDQSEIVQSWRPVVLNEFFATLEGHSNRIVSLDWNPHNSNQLLSGSMDSISAVWDVTTSQVVATFQGHTGRIHCCLWSRRDPDMIISGGDSNHLLFWRPSQQPSILPCKVKKMKPADIDRQSPSSVQSLTDEHSLTATPEPKETVSVSSEDFEEVQLLAARRIAELKLVCDKGDEETSSESNHDSRERTDGHKSASNKKNAKRRRPAFFAKSINSLDSSAAAQERALLELVTFKTDPTNETLPPYLALFGGRRNLLTHLDLELAYQLESAHLENYFQLLFWTGKIGLAKRQASILHYMPDWLMSMFCLASTAGQMDVEIIDEKVRNVMQETDDTVLAATYYLVSHRVQSAIDLLKSKKAYIEAIVISVLRLSPSDPIKNDLMALLADKASSNGNYTLASRCYVSLGNYREAVRWIEIRPTAQNYWIAAKMFDQLSERTICREYLMKLIMDCFNHGKYDVIKWRDTLKSSNIDCNEYLLLMEIYLSVEERDENLSINALLTQFRESLLTSNDDISNLVNELISGDISRQHSNQWKQAFSYFIQDLFITLYNCKELPDDISQRLIHSLKLCASIDQTGASNVANHLVRMDAESPPDNCLIPVIDSLKAFLHNSPNEVDVHFETQFSEEIITES